MISVIVPVYNAEKTLNQCVDSILSQKYKDFELLLINDGSKDKSGEICDKYALTDNRVRVFHQDNKGVSAARNVGFENMHGEFVTFCDSDDWVEDTWLSDYMDNYNGEDVLFQNAIWHKKGENDFYRNVILEKNTFLHEKILNLYCRHTLGYVWAALFKSDIILNYNIRFNTNFVFREDMNFSLQYLKYISSINILPVKNYHYNLPITARNYSNVSFNNLDTLIEENKLISELIELNTININKISNITYPLIIMHLISLSEKKNKTKIECYLEKIKQLSVTQKGLTLKYKIIHYLIQLPNYIASNILFLVNRLK